MPIIYFQIPTDLKGDSACLGDRLLSFEQKQKKQKKENNDSNNTPYTPSHLNVPSPLPPHNRHINKRRVAVSPDGTPVRSNPVPH